MIICKDCGEEFLKDDMMEYGRCGRCDAYNIWRVTTERYKDKDTEKLYVAISRGKSFNRQKVYKESLLVIPEDSTWDREDIFIKEICRSIERMMNGVLEIDFTEEAKIELAKQRAIGWQMYLEDKENER